MNKIHRTLWSAIRGAFIVTHEKAATHGKLSGTSSLDAGTGHSGNKVSTKVMLNFSDTQ